MNSVNEFIRYNHHKLASRQYHPRLSKSASDHAETQFQTLGYKTSVGVDPDARLRFFTSLCEAGKTCKQTTQGGSKPCSPSPARSARPRPKRPPNAPNVRARSPLTAARSKAKSSPVPTAAPNSKLPASIPSPSTLRPRKRKIGANKFLISDFRLLIEAPLRGALIINRKSTIADENRLDLFARAVRGKAADRGAAKTRDR